MLLNIFLKFNPLTHSIIFQRLLKQFFTIYSFILHSLSALLNLNYILFVIFLSYLWLYF